MIFSNKRIPYYDTLKALLIVLVVFGHTLELFPFTSALRTAYLLIYSFHMPLFLFVCGFFAKWKKQRVLGCLITFFLFSALQILFKIFVVAPPQRYTFTDVCYLFFYPQWGAWFLLAYAAYLGSLKLIKKVKLWQICAAFCLTLAIGFLPSVDEYLSLSRVFYFFPFFLLGKWCGQFKSRFHQLISKMQNGKLAPLVFCLAIAMLAATFFYLIVYGNQLNRSFFYGKYAYATYRGLFKRILCLTLALCNGFAVLLLIPMQSNKRSAFTSVCNVVGQRTFSIYLCHILLLMVFKHYYAPPAAGWTYLPLSLSLSVILLALTSLRPLHVGANFLLNGLSKR